MFDKTIRIGVVIVFTRNYTTNASQWVSLFIFYASLRLSNLFHHIIDEKLSRHYYVLITCCLWNIYLSFDIFRKKNNNRKLKKKLLNHNVILQFAKVVLNFKLTEKIFWLQISAAANLQQNKPSTFWITILAQTFFSCWWKLIHSLTLLQISFDSTVGAEPIQQRQQVVVF